MPVAKGQKVEPVNTKLRWCDVCRQPFSAARRTARYCSVRCRVAAHRKDKAAPAAGTTEPGAG